MQKGTIKMQRVEKHNLKPPFVAHVVGSDDIIWMSEMSVFYKFDTQDMYSYCNPF